MKEDEIRKLVVDQVMALIEFYNGDAAIVAGKKENLNGVEVDHDFIIENLNDLTSLQLTQDFNIYTRIDPISKKLTNIFTVVNQGTVKAQAQTPKAKPVATLSRGKHEYLPPPFYDTMLLNFKCAKDPKYKSKNILFVGHKGTGKTSCVDKICVDAGFDRVYHQNGTSEMSVCDFLGSKTVVVDEATKQNFITFQRGALTQAFMHGTEVDEKGCQILYDENGAVTKSPRGKPKIVGAPAIYFFDEYEVVDPRVLTSVFNRALEIPPNAGESRTIELSENGGEIIKSHPGLVIIFSGNLLGKGIEDDSQAGYSSQNNVHDDSTLDRIDVVYEFGYNTKAEKKLMMYYLQDDVLVSKIQNFVKSIREQWEAGNVDSLFSTRNLVTICDQIKRYKSEITITDPVGLAFFETIYSFLRMRERKAWDTTFDMFFGSKMEKNFANKYKSDMWIPRRNTATSLNS